jgi:8-oxo-dGTP pyrophosphatase MutT (NUDIX family)
VTTRRTKRWIIPKGWPIKGLKPAKTAAREAYEEAGVRGRVGAKPLGFFTYEKLIDQDEISIKYEVKVFPLVVKSHTESWPEFEQRLIQWVEPERAIAMTKSRSSKK